MTARLLLANLAAWWLQTAALAGVAALLVRLARLRAPALRAGVWRTVLVSGLLLPFLQPWRPSTASSVGMAVADVALGSNATPALDLASSILCAVFVVAGVRLALLGHRFARLRKWARAAAPYADDLQPELTALAGARAELRLSAHVTVPATMGWRLPLVLLPEAFPHEPRERRRDALLHELLHVRRTDWPIALAEEVLAEALWFHPAVRWVVRELRLVREQAVDAAVVACTHDRRGYAETLLVAASTARAPRLAASLFTSGLERRIDLLMSKEVAMSRTRTICTLAAGAAVMALVAAGATRAMPILGAEAGAEKGKAPMGVGERKLIQKVNPTYPTDAKARGIEGRVVLDVLITAAGEVTDVKVVKGPSELGDAAVAGVRQWRYAPADVDTRATLTIRFSLAKKAEKP